MKNINTNCYVWGEGYQVDASQEFSNFTPKKIRPFEGASTPNIVDISFGWYHEAYIDKNGKLYVSKKNKMTSVKINEIKDGERELTEVTTLPAKTKVRQVVFTRRRMFVMSEDGKLYVFPIEEKAPERSDYFSRKKPEFTGDLKLDNPVLVKDLPPIKQMAAGLDHFLALDKKG